MRSRGLIVVVRMNSSMFHNGHHHPQPGFVSGAMDSGTDQGFPSGSPGLRFWLKYLATAWPRDLTRSFS